MIRSVLSAALCACGIFALLPGVVFAADASLFLSPITGTYLSGEPITIRVMVGTGGESANAIEGVLEYDSKKIEILSLDRSNSLLTSWTKEPFFDNAKGEIAFAGSMSGTSSFSGSRGEVLAVTLRGLRSEEAHVTFVSGSASAVHAADGTGGNLLSTLSNGIYVFIPKEMNPEQPAALLEETPVEATSTPEGEVLGAASGTPVLSSRTHPDEHAWYASATSSMSWEMPTGVAAVRLALDQKSTGEGSVRYGAPKNEKEILDIPDGIWYLHLTREWEDLHTDTFHYRLQIDTRIPEDLLVSETPRSDATDPSAIFSLSATDTLSGVERYEMSFDGGPALTWRDDGTGTYRTPALPPGDHTLLVRVLDRAGNATSTQVSFRVDHLSTPSVSPKEGALFAEGKPLLMELSGPPRSVLSIAIAREGDSPVVEEYTLDGTGKGSFQSALLTAPGMYRVHATAKTENGAVSLASPDVDFTVESSFFGILKRHPMIPIVLIGSALLLFLAWFFWRRIDDEDDDEDASTDDDDEVEQEETAPKEERRVRTAYPERSGTIILGDRPRPSSSSLPITRL